MYVEVKTQKVKSVTLSEIRSTILSGEREKKERRKKKKKKGS